MDLPGGREIEQFAAAQNPLRANRKIKEEISQASKVDTHLLMKSKTALTKCLLNEKPSINFGFNTVIINNITTT